MKRGQIWTRTRLGHDSKVIIVGHESLTAIRDRVLVVPISDVRPVDLIEPTVADIDGNSLGVAVVPHVGEVSKTYLTSCAGSLAPTSVENLNIALRAALDL